MKRILCHLSPVSVLFVVLISLCWQQSYAQEPADTSELKQLETLVFDQQMSEEEARQRIEELSNPETRTQAFQSLMKRGAGWQALLCEIASETEDLDTAVALADLVHNLDSRYQDTDSGRRLLGIYQGQGEQILPAAWKAWRENSLDLRATAQLMALDPETVWTWLGSTGDHRDPARYLLLRLRESSRNEVLKDAFVRQHLFEQPASTLAFVMRDVLPMPLHYPRGYENKIEVCGGKRLVGRILLNAVSVEGVVLRSGVLSAFGGRVARTETILQLPAIAKLHVYSRIEFTHQTVAQQQRNLAWHLRLNTTLFMRPEEGQPPQVYPMVSDIAFAQCPPGLASLPLLELTEDQAKWLRAKRGQIPEWMRAYIAERYHPALRFFPDEEKYGVPQRIKPVPPPEQFVMPEGNTGSLGQIKPLAEDAVGLLILPARVQTRPGGGDDETLAQLALDRLSEEVDGQQLAQVVNRSQLDALLAEQSLAQDVMKALTGYDVMLRLDVNASQLRPQASFTWVHSSTGSLLASQETAWPLTEAEVPELVTATRTAVKAVGDLDHQLPRVRLLGSSSQLGQSRMSPLTRRLLQAFESSLLSSEKVTVMQHLEAGSAREESLLELMGLSRLPGGRTFSPAADVSLEIELQEQEAAGKSFEQTPVTLNVRLIRAKDDENQEIKLTGLVKDFDLLLVNAWEQVAEKLEFAPRAAATEWIASETDRRRQAEAELTASRNNSGGAMEQLARVDAALTIDPTYEAARIRALEIMKALFDTHDPLDPGLPLRAVRDSAELLRHFKTNNREVGKDVAYPQYKLPIETAVAAVRYAEQLDHASEVRNSQRLTDHAEMIDSLQKMVDLYLPSGSWVLNNASRYAVSTVYRGMETHGVSLAERRKWLDAVLAVCDDYPYPPQAVKLYAYWEQFWIDAAHLALEENDYDRAVKLTEKIREHAAGKFMAGDDLKPQLLFLLASLDDKDLFPGFAPLFGIQVNLDRPDIHWPPTPGGWGPPPAVKHQRIEYREAPNLSRARSIAALTATKDRLYVLVSEGLDTLTWKDFEGFAPRSRTARVGWLPLDDAGKPVGRALQLPTDVSKSIWSEMHLLPELEKGFELPIAAVEIDGNLWLISTAGGLACFDADKKNWIRFGAEQGLPASSFYSLQRLDENRLLLAGKGENHDVAHFTFDVQTHEVILLRRTQESGQRLLRQLQPTGDDWNCWTAAGLWRSLLSEDAKFTPFSTPQLYGWREDPKALGLGYIRSSLDVAGRQFVTSDSGLYEVNEEAEIISSWLAEKPLSEPFPVSALNGRVIVLPGDSPIRDEHAVRCGKTLVFAKGGLLIYAPESDTWYGPVEDFMAAHIYASGANLWITTGSGLLHVDPRDVVAAAKKAGRVYSTSDYRERQAAARHALTAVEQGKLHYAQQEFDQAISRFEKALKDNARDGEAGMLLGDALVQLKRLDDAVVAYDQLGTNSNPQWAAEGLYRAAVVLHHQKNWDELRERLEQIDKQFSQLTDYRRTVLNKYREALEKADKP